MDNTMWLLKGVLVGMSIFVIGLMLYLAICMWRKPSQHPKSGDRGEIAFDFFPLLWRFFLQSPLFYAAFVSALLIGCSLVVTS
jgi:hypothetical protein